MFLEGDAMLPAKASYRTLRGWNIIPRQLELLLRFKQGAILLLVFRVKVRHAGQEYGLGGHKMFFKMVLTYFQPQLTEEKMTDLKQNTHIGVYYFPKKD